MSDAADVWAQGDAYERYVGRWSRVVAREFIAWLDVAPGATWLDVGCGTGALSATIAQVASPARVIAVDLSQGFVAHARSHVSDGRVEFRVGNALALPVSDALAGATVSGFFLNFVPDMAKAVAEMRRATGPGGSVGAYVWDYAGGMEMMRLFWDAAVAVDPAAAERDEARRFPVCRPEALAALFRGGGLSDVETRAIDIATTFADFDDFWSPFLGGQGPAPGYCLSLASDRQAALRDTLRSKLPIAPDGSIALTARAWAVRGTVPPADRG